MAGTVNGVTRAQRHAYVCAFVALVFVCFSAHVPAASPDHTWTGANSAQWSDAGNWSPAGVPSSGDTLLFPQVALAQRTSTNDLAGLTLGGLLFTGSGYTIDGAGIGLSGNLTLTSANDETLALPIDVQGPLTIAMSTGETLTLTGALSGSGPLNVMGDFVELSGSLDAYSGPVTVGPDGYLILDATSNAALTILNEHAVVFDGAALPNVSVQDGGYSTVSGNGTIGAVAAKTLIAGGGVLHTGDVSINGGGASFYGLGGASAGRFDVTGTVTLDPNTTLYIELDPSFVPVVGQELVLIDNDGNEAINGTFQTLPEGAILTINFVQYQLSYVGGDGNDVTLTAYPGQSLTSTAITSISPVGPVVGQGTDIGYSISGGQNPTGSVTVAATTGETCTDTVAAGQCSIVFASAGPRALVATYAGDGNNSPSTSQPTSLTVNAASTSLSLVSAAPEPSLTGMPVTVTVALAVVAPGAGVPGGTIAVAAPDSSGCTIVLPATTCALTFTQPGVKSITAQYSGDQNFLAALAVPLAHTVDGPPTIDLAIAIDDESAFAQGGQPVTYLITAQNTGPADAHGATVHDILPPNLSGATWTCAPVGANASCTASGSGAILDVIDLPAGTAVVYQLTATVAALPEQPVIHQVSVSPAAGETDSNPGNNAATDVDAVGIFADSFDHP